jgi:hypothetical protein
MRVVPCFKAELAENHVLEGETNRDMKSETRCLEWRVRYVLDRGEDKYHELRIGTREEGAELVGHIGHITHHPEQNLSIE